MLQKIDWFFLIPFEKGCHILQRLTGKTNYYFSGMISAWIVLLMLGIFFDIFPEWFSKESFLHDGMNGLMFWGGVVLFSICALGWSRAEKEAYERIQKCLSNPSKINPFDGFLRICCLVWTLIVFLASSFVTPCDILWFTFYAFFFYLISCDPLPPCKGKIRE